MFIKDRDVILGSSLLVTTAIAGVATFKYFSLRKKLQKDNVYETEKSLNEYILLHYEDCVLRPNSSIIPNTPVLSFKGPDNPSHTLHIIVLNI